MAAFVKGKVVIVPFPFSNFSGAKRRPALVVANLSGDDFILCQITSQPPRDTYSVSLQSSDFSSDSLPISTSYIRPNKLFTADGNIVLRSAGTIKSTKSDEVIRKLVEILNN